MMETAWTIPLTCETLGLKTYNIGIQASSIIIHGRKRVPSLKNVIKYYAIECRVYGFWEFGLKTAILEAKEGNKGEVVKKKKQRTQVRKKNHQLWRGFGATFPS